ncbi:flagellar basal body rod protein FlgC [Miltoncostaea marina]|uniref:flagellar basal body rod protein FlgC n=1 Tax=Miltoncostaea marina TaxID=2843215 RepID=UPI001C3C7ED6|nr:flagellar basal body rod protein FlgC [Miltoncostaea marina]
MSMFPALGISATGLTAERLRMDVIASNLANADSTNGVGDAYRRKVVSTAPASGERFTLPAGVGGAAGGAAAQGVAVTGITEDPTPLRRVYEPGHPEADADGYVTRPNVDAVTEMVDMVAATRAFQANVTAFEATKSMHRDALRIIQ